MSGLSKKQCMPVARACSADMQAVGIYNIEMCTGILKKWELGTGVNPNIVDRNCQYPR